MAEGLQTASHGATVLDAARGGVSAADYRAFVLESWRRCIDDFGLAPERRDEPEVLDRADIAERREACCHLVEMAKSEMTNLYQQVAGSGYSILLSDADGVVLNYIGDPLFTTAAASAGMVNGASWSESAQGTNGIGTCLVEKRPIVVHREEHFFTKNTGLTCSAAPIFEPTGEIAGVLDASSESHMAQQHTVALVNMSAQLIENRLFICRMRDNYVVRFHSRPEFVSTLGEGIIAFDPSGRLRAANRSALFQLGLSTVDEIAGRPIQEIFNLRADDALSRAQRQSTHPQPLRDVQGGRRFYASFQAPSEQMESNSRGLAVPRAFAPMEAPAAGLPLDGMQFGDTRMKRNAERAAKLIERDIPFIVLGETGTGKDVFARALHQAGPRRSKPFVAVNCASIPETLIESELFGYRPGAFTGASREGSRGKIVQAHGGTLFLDEIGDMPLELQARLLRVLEERAVIPLGGETPIDVDIQLISATHQNLKQQVMDGGFREDLYYRLHGLSLQLPPLREREDRRELIQHLLDVEAGGPDRLEIEPEALALMDAYEWPGNIRQLRNTLRTLVGLSEGGVIRVGDLPDDLLLGEDSLELPARPSNPLDVAERDAILRELEAAHWNVTRVASKLTLSRNTLYRKMKRYGIKPPR
ncbi:MAG: sigma-54-dependent Fis family transcriptional regulator [Thiohalocapsa sp.]|nr:sigma-54-dependent Fis family transcriptional regulator [Thiohalocapsa sp.]